MIRNLNFNKAQGAVEFVIIVSSILFFFVVFFSIVQMNIQKKNVEKERIIARNVALEVQSEINLAAESSEGYYREFQIPESIIGEDYVINISENHVNLFFRELVISHKIRPVNGSLQKGTNTILKQNENVFINQ